MDGRLLTRPQPQQGRLYHQATVLGEMADKAAAQALLVLLRLLVVLLVVAVVVMARLVEMVLTSARREHLLTQAALAGIGSQQQELLEQPLVRQPGLIWVQRRAKPWHLMVPVLHGLQAIQAKSMGRYRDYYSHN